MAATSLCFFLVFCLHSISIFAQDGNRFIYNGFTAGRLHLQDLAKVKNGLLQLTNITELRSGYGFHPNPIKFNTSLPQSISFSTDFVFVLISTMPNFGGNGMAFIFSPSLNFSEGSVAGSYLGLFNVSNDGQPSNHILAVELDTVESPEFGDIDSNHVGVDVNSLTSNDSATAAYYSDREKKNITLKLESGDPMKMWIDYNGEEMLLNVTLAPSTSLKPSRPLLSTSIDLSKIFLDSMYVGFSAATGTRSSDHYVLGWSFSKYGEAQDLDISKLPQSPRRRKVKKKLDPVIISLIAVLTAMVIAGIGAVYFLRKKRYAELYEDWEKEYGPQRFSYKNLYKATKGFKDKEIIGKGGFGKVYKGILPSNEQIAIKRVTHDSGQGMKQFVAEIVSMGRLRHRNLVQLRGYCRRKGELLLVYDYMPNGSLDKILYGGMTPNLNWFQRIKILRGVACGLFYLHEEWEQVVLHRDIKPANVLLDSDLNGRLGDFGLARLHDHGTDLQTTNLVGTVGYLAPELLRTGKATTSTDVFAFGTFILEIACGRRPIVPDELDLVDWVVETWKNGSILDASDPRLEGIYAEEQMDLILKLGLFCSHPNPSMRPNMRQVMQYLDGDAKFPDISPDNVIEAFKASNSDVMLQFSSLFESAALQTMSTLDSILSSGR